MRLLESPLFTIIGGRVELGSENLLGADFKALRRIRGNQMAMVFQDPMTSLNPARTVGAQVAEAVRIHRKVSRADARRRAVELFDRVGIPDAEHRLGSFPHQLSGGLRQRVVIAMALACNPRLLIADEPTTALDVTIQAQVLDLLRDLARNERLAVLFVTHDLGVVAELCDRVAVLYAGQVVEQASPAELFASPRHPYTAGLIAASRAAAADRHPVPIPGRIPPVGNVPTGCRFHPRCPYADDACAEHAPALTADGHSEVRCLHWEELHLKGVS